MVLKRWGENMESESPRKRMKEKRTWEFEFEVEVSDNTAEQLNLTPSSFSDKDSARAFMDQVWERAYSKRKDIGERSIYSTMFREIQEESAIIKYIEKWKKVTLPVEELQRVELERKDKLEIFLEALVALKKAKEKLREVSQVKTVES